MKKPTTRRGAQTRAHILATAADLIHQRGVAATSIDDILEASGAGKSQLYHYFEDKNALVREVVAHNLEVVLSAQGSRLENLSTWEGIETWLDSIADAHEDSGLVGGCRIGSLAAEVADRDERLRLDLVDALLTRPRERSAPMPTPRLWRRRPWPSSRAGISLRQRRRTSGPCATP